MTQQGIAQQNSARQNTAQRNASLRVNIDTIYGASELMVGETDNYRVRMRPGARWPIQYFWDMGDGTQSLGNNIIHSYSKPGHYRITVWARNSLSSDSSSFAVNVRSDEHGRTETPVVATVNTNVPLPRQPSQNNRSETEIPDKVIIDEDGQAYAWVIGTHLDKASAERSVREYRERKIPGIRILLDTSGNGANAYRVVIGNYLSLDSAARSKSTIEEIVGRKVSLFAFSK